MYLVIDSNNELNSFGNLTRVMNYIVHELKLDFYRMNLSKEDINLYVAMIYDFFIHDMNPELTPYFDEFDCYLSDLYSIYKQIM